MTLLPVRRVDADVAIVGAGFSGAILAMVLRRQGRSVALLERGRHPRFAIGESTTPLSNLLIEELAGEFDLPRLRPFSKWGTWRATYPEIACGLKRGFSFVHHAHGERWTDDETHARQLLVAASPNGDVSDTHWYRPDFDHWLVREAEAEGARYVDELALAHVRFEANGAILEGARLGEAIEVRAGFVVDASGPRGFLATQLGLGEPVTRWLPPTQGLWSHFTGVQRWDALNPPDGTPPYPIDDAALHHVFPGGWIWILRFANGLTSGGAAVTDALAAELRVADGAAAAWSRLLDRLPSVRDQFAGADATIPIVHASRVAFRARQLAGPRWALMPSAAGVIDPLLSTGFPLTLLGLQRLARAHLGHPSGPRRAYVGRKPGGSREDAGSMPGDGREETRHMSAIRPTWAELDATEQLVAGLYASMGDFRVFKRLSYLYFAAASYTEAARRRGEFDRAPGYLLESHPRFGPGLRRCAAAAVALAGAPRTEDTRAARQRLLDDIDRTVEPFDTIGLLDDTRRSWFPA